MSKKIKIQIQGITSSQIHAGAYALILAESGGTRRIPVVIGSPEAQSIAIAIERISTPRPLTHDLFISSMQAYGIWLKEILIYNYDNGIFASNLIWTDGEREITQDARTSDAIALAIRARCSMYILSSVADLCGVEKEKESVEYTFSERTHPTDLVGEDAILQEFFHSLNNKELQHRLEESIQVEDYENAKYYQEEIKRRQENI